MSGEHIINEVIEDAAPLFGIEPGDLFFFNNKQFRSLIFQRAGGNGNEMRSLIFASILNYTENPMVSFEDGRLFFGSEVNAMDALTIEKVGITHILNMAGQYSSEFLNLDERITYKSITTEDIPQAILPIEESVSFIENSLRSGKKVLVHCIEGKSRSGSILIAYFMKNYRWSYEKALSYVSRKRLAVPNEGFKNQLKEFEQN